jgi:glycosyltransferase involved in cell wall biosynthesis
MTTTKRRDLVSIGLPVYNGAQHLRESLDALLSQSHHRFELIISDNASTDDTSDICLEYAGRDDRIRYYRNEANHGSIVNFNRVLALAEGEYFMWAADHDNWGREYVSRCVQVLDNDSTVVLCSTEAAWIDSSGEVIEDIPTPIDTRGLNKVSRFRVILRSLDNCYPIYGLIRMAALEQIGPLRQSFAPDILLLTELSLLGAFAFIPERLFYLRRTKGWGDVYVHAEKLKINIASRRLGLRLYCEFLWQRCQCVTRHFKGPVGKSFAVLSVVWWMLVKYRWIIVAFPGSGSTRRVREIEPLGKSLP